MARVRRWVLYSVPPILAVGVGAVLVGLGLVFPRTVEDAFVGTGFRGLLYALGGLAIILVAIGERRIDDIPWLSLVLALVGGYAAYRFLVGHFL